MTIETATRPVCTQHIWTPASGWDRSLAEASEAVVPGRTAVLVFGDVAAETARGALAELADACEGAAIVGCTTAGEVAGTTIHDGTLVATLIRFGATQVRLAMREIPSPEQSFEAGRALVSELDAGDLAHVFVLSDGLHVNGSQLAAGIASGLAPGVVATGGLAGDGDRFETTAVLVGSRVHTRVAAAIGFYGDRLAVGTGSFGGWDAYGPQRIVTRADGATVYELDGQPALDLYERYLGPESAGLPASGLLFPMSVRLEGAAADIVRTLLAVDREQRSVTFAGDVPEGSVARLMKANFDRLIDAALDAADTSLTSLDGQPADLAVAISCVGRRLVLGQRCEEEIEAAAARLGRPLAMTGFYSYGEISPLASTTGGCALHNQTMTITTFRET